MTVTQSVTFLETPRTWPCLYCDHVSVTEAESKRHRNGHPKAERIVTCPTCGRVFVNQGTCYIRHLDSHATEQERFWAKVDKNHENGCWHWTAGVSHAGYAKFRTQGRTVAAYRLAYEMLVGPIPEGLTLDHLCANRRCVNPEHLEPVTQQENYRRALASRRERFCSHCDFSTINLSALLVHTRWKHREVPNQGTPE